MTSFTSIQALTAPCKEDRGLPPGSDVRRQHVDTPLWLIPGRSPATGLGLAREARPLSTPPVPCISALYRVSVPWRGRDWGKRRPASSFPSSIFAFAILWTLPHVTHHRPFSLQKHSRHSNV